MRLQLVPMMIMILPKKPIPIDFTSVGLADTRPLEIANTHQILKSINTR